MARERGLILIIAWKFFRAGVSFAGAIAALVLVLTHQAVRLEAWAEVAHDHAVSVLALWLTRWFASALEPRHIGVVAGALALDGVMLLVEGTALWRGWRWGPWLVVVVTGLIIPFEVVGLVRHPAAFRVLTIVVNAAIVFWLARHALRRPRGEAQR